jgi:alanine racemase
MRSANILIDKNALIHNLEQIKKQAPNAQVLAMVKSNAYGHGVKWVLDGLKDADAFGVATFLEALEINDLYQKKVTGKKPIVLIEGVFSEQEWQKAVDYDFGMVIHCEQQVQWAEAYLPNSNSFSQTVWLKYNTGMNRLGFDKKKLPSIAKRLFQKGYRLILISHFACSDDKNHPMNDEQITAFDNMLTLLKQTIDPNIGGSLCNSAGIINFSNHHYDWIRPGIALYGASPFAHKTAKSLGLKPVMTFCAKIMAVHQLMAGECVGYGALWQAKNDAKIAIVSIGYGDGYPRVVKNAYITLKQDNKEYQAPIIGRVAMDMLMIDVSLLPDTIDVGCDAVLWGQAPSVDEVANCADTIGYELLCQTTIRPNRFLV